MSAADDRKQNAKLALYLAAAGFWVFPVLNKQPLVSCNLLADTAVTDADREAAIKRKQRLAARNNKPYFPPVAYGSTRDPKHIKALWAKFPDALPAIPCGLNRLAVLDLDAKEDAKRVNGVKHFAELFKAEEFKRTGCFEVKTPSSGRHIYFRNSDETSTAHKRSCADLKANGGFVVAPMAIRDDGGVYKPVTAIPLSSWQEDPLATCFADILPVMPEFIREQFRRAEAEKTEARGAAPGCEVNSLKAYQGVLYWLHKELKLPFDFTVTLNADESVTVERSQVAEGDELIGPGLYHDIWTRFGGAAGDFGLSRDAAADLALVLNLNEQYSTEPGDEDKIAEEFVGQLHDKRNDDIGCHYGQFERFVQGDGDELAVDTTDGSEPPEPAKKKKGLSWYGDMESEATEVVSYAIDGLSTLGEVIVSVGAPGSGKTADKLHLGLNLAQGRDHHGRKVERTGFMFVGGENELQEKLRLRADRKYYERIWDLPFGHMLKPITLFDINGKPTRDEKLIITSALSFEAKHGVKCGYIVIDNLRRVIAPGSTGLEEDVTVVFKSLERIRNATGATVDIIHHTIRDGTRFAGSGAIESLCDSLLAYSLGKNGVGLIKAEKCRAGKKGQRLHYKLASISVTHDNWDRPVETVVIVDTDGKELEVEIEEDTKPKAPNTRKQAVIDLMSQESLTSAGVAEKLGLHRQVMQRTIIALEKEGLAVKGVKDLWMLTPAGIALVTKEEAEQSSGDEFGAVDDE